MHLLVGLGNKGLEYELTRHNFGFLLIDQIIKDYRFEVRAKKFRSEVFVGEINDQKIVAIKPQTFMNLSGLAVEEAARFYKIETKKNILVFHDDVDLALGKIKTKIGGGNCGHNGLKSIDEKIGKDYSRLRLGVGRPSSLEFTISDYVLGKFGKEEIESVKEINKKISQLIPLLIEGRADLFLNKFSV